MIKVIIKDIGKHIVWKGMNFYTPVELMIDENEAKTFKANAKIFGLAKVEYINPKKTKKASTDVPVQSIAEAVAAAVKAEEEEAKEKEEETEEKAKTKDKGKGKGKGKKEK